MPKLKRLALFAPVLALAFFVACGSCQKQPAVETGSDSPEDLAQKYLQAVTNKDFDLFESLLLDKDDLRPFTKQMNKQGITVFHQFVLRDFQTKNQSYFGQPLKFVAFRLGQEVWTTDKYGLHRGSTVIAELADGSKVNLEINFISRLGQKWKIFSLRYLKDLKGANPSANPAPLPGALPGAKFGPEKSDVQLKIKKVDPQPDEQGSSQPGEGQAGGPAAPPADKGEKPESKPKDKK